MGVNKGWLRKGEILVKKFIAVISMCLVFALFVTTASAACYDGFCGTSVKASKQPARAKMKGRHTDEDKAWNDGEWAPITISTPRETKRFERI